MPLDYGSSSNSVTHLVLLSQILASRLQATDRWVCELLGEQQQSIVASWRRFREGLGGSFDVPHGFVHPY